MAVADLGTMVVVRAGDDVARLCECGECYDEQERERVCVYVPTRAHLVPFPVGDVTYLYTAVAPHAANFDIDSPSLP